MNVEIIPTASFAKEAKKLLKKYRSLKQELIDLNQLLESNPNLGTKISENTFKIRLAVKNKGRGKSGGIRVVTYQLFEEDNEFRSMVNFYL